MIEEFVHQNLPTLYMTTIDGDFTYADGIVIPELEELAKKIRLDTLKEVREKAEWHRLEGHDVGMVEDILEELEALDE